MSGLVILNIANGVATGAFYVLMALGLSLILNLSGVINFAHGGFLALGGYFAFMLIPSVGFFGALLLAPVLTALVGLIVEQVLVRWLYGRDPLYSLLLTFGLAFIFQGGTRFLWGAQGLPMSIPPVLQQPLSSNLFFLTSYRVFNLVVVTAVVALLFLLLRRTRFGIRIRAGTLDLDTVASLGVNVRLLGRRLSDAELHRHHRRRCGLPRRHRAGRPPHRHRHRRHHGVLPCRQRSGDVCDDGGGTAHPPARPLR
jgi:branched-chain amino acid transport system permease protein